MSEVTPDLLLRAYAAGIFPMAESADAAELRWVEPRFRGVLPLDGFHCPRSLRKLVRRGAFEVTADQAFDAVITGCAQPRPGRESTWINAEIRSLYTALHAMGRAHSVECWKDGALVGGLYGVSLGAAFFGESMFSLARDASKVALVHLVARLRRAEFALLDAQFLTDHLARFGAIELPRRQYKRLLSAALEREARFPRNLDAAGEAELARLVGGEAAAER